MGKVLNGIGVLALVFALILGNGYRYWPYGPCKHVGLQPAPSDVFDHCTPPPGMTLAQQMMQRGYAVANHMISADELELLMQQNNAYEFNALPGEKHFPKLLQKALPPKAYSRLKDLIVTFQKETGRKWAHEDGPVDGTYSRAMFFVTNNSDKSIGKRGQVESTSYPWHQDHGFFWESGYQYHLNMYYIIHKPDPNEAGLEVVPFDWLQKRSPEFFEIANANPAAWYSTVGEHRTHMVADVTAYNDAVYVLDYHFDQLRCTPKLIPGDLLILRGDAIHRTQPHNSERISMSVRVSPFEHSVMDMLTGGGQKYNFLLRNEVYYASKAIRQFVAVDDEGCFSMTFCKDPTDSLTGKDKLLALAVGTAMRASIRIGYGVRWAAGKTRWHFGAYMGEDMHCVGWPREPLER